MHPKGGEQRGIFRGIFYNRRTIYFFLGLSLAILALEFLGIIKETGILTLLVIMNLYVISSLNEVNGTLREMNGTLRGILAKL